MVENDQGKRGAQGGPCQQVHVAKNDESVREYHVLWKQDGEPVCSVDWVFWHAPGWYNNFDRALPRVVAVAQPHMVVVLDIAALSQDLESTRTWLRALFRSPRTIIATDPCDAWPRGFAFSPKRGDERMPVLHDPGLDDWEARDKTYFRQHPAEQEASTIRNKATHSENGMWV